MANEHLLQPQTLEAPQEVTQAGEYMPTLVVGLGGSGVEVVRRIKSRLAQRYQDVLIQYVCIDTDEGSFAPTPDMPGIEEAEQVDVVSRHATDVLREIDLHPEIGEWLLDDVPVHLLERGRGAGTVRAVGRFGFFSRFEEARRGLERACERLMGIPERIERRLGAAADQVSISDTASVYVVGSICGGTGAGIFLDTALLLRHFLGEADPLMIGVLVCPSAFASIGVDRPHVMARIKANSYAALKELQYFMDSQSQRHGWAFAYPGLASIQVERPPFDECYLVEGANPRNEKLPDKEAVFEMVAQAVVAEMASPMGTAFRARAVDRFAGVFATPDPLARTSERQFSSFAVASLVFPAQELLTYCCQKAALECITDHFLGGPATLSEQEEEVDQLLPAHGLDDRGPHSNQVVDKLLSIGQGRIASSAEYGMEQSTLDASNDEFLTVHSTRDSELESSVLPTVENRATDWADEVIASARQVIAGKAEQLLQTRGCGAAAGFLRALQAAEVAMGNEMAAENRQAELTCVHLQQDIDAWTERLRTYGGIIDRLFRAGLDEQLKRDILGTFNALVENEIRRRGRTVAQRVFEALAQEAGRLCRRVISIRQRMENLQSMLGTSLQNIRAAAQPVSGRYVLELRVIGPGEYERFYREYRQEPMHLCQLLTERTSDGLLDVLATGNEQDVGNSLINAAAETFRAPISALNIVEELRRMAEDEGTDLNRKVSAMLDTLLDMAQPFWRVHCPGDTPLGHDYVVSTPVGTDDEQTQAITRVVGEWLDERAGADIQPQQVSSGYPYAIDVVRREHGARAYWLRETDSWEHQYRVSREKGGFPLHIDRRFTTPPVPELAPEQELEAKQLFALAVAYGYVARRGPNLWYYGSAPDAAGRVAPKYASDWATVWSTFARGIEPVGAAIQQEDLLANSRENAVEAFVANREAIQQLEDVLRDYVTKAGSAVCVDELVRYIDEVLNPAIDQRTDLCDQYIQERDWLALYVWDKLDDTANIPRVARS